MTRGAAHMIHYSESVETRPVSSSLGAREEDLIVSSRRAAETRPNAAPANKNRSFRRATLPCVHA